MVFESWWKMENFRSQPGLNCDAGAMFQNLELDTSGLYNFNDWVSIINLSIILVHVCKIRFKAYSIVKV